MDAVCKKILDYLNAEVRKCDDDYEEESRYSGSKEKTAKASGAYWEARKIRDTIKDIISGGGREGDCILTKKVLLAEIEHHKKK